MTILFGVALFFAFESFCCACSSSASSPLSLSLSSSFNLSFGTSSILSQALVKLDTTVFVARISAS